MDTRLIGRVIDTVRSVNPLLSVSAASLDLNQPPASGTVRAQVAARLADGTFRVLIDGKALKLSLPADIKPGDVLQLRVVGRDAAAANPGASFAGKGVSTAGQLVADLVKQPSTGPARQARPVLDLPPEHADTLPEPLARAVERSGLFYESHQARWVNGEFPLERLQQEPQASVGKQPAAQSEAPLPGQPPAVTAEESEAPLLAKPATAPVAGLFVEGEEDVAETRTATTVQDSRDLGFKVSEKATEVAARETLNIVRQQLETLETRQIHWLGEIWPGQTMRWEIGEGPQQDRPNGDASQEWDSSFALDLPALGPVGAELVLSGNRLRIRLRAQDEETAALMRQASPQLVHALESAGIEPLALEVQHRDPAL